MSRPARLVLITLAVFAFAAITVVVGRVLGAATSARNSVTELVKLQSKGDALGVESRVRGCSRDPACVARIGAQVQRLRSPGRVRILRLEGITDVAVGSHTDTARVAWKAGNRLPVVQCVRVRRTGNPVAGYDIHILSLSAPIGREASC